MLRRRSVWFVAAVAFAGVVAIVVQIPLRALGVPITIARGIAFFFAAVSWWPFMRAVPREAGQPRLGLMRWALAWALGATTGTLLETFSKTRPFAVSWLVFALLMAMIIVQAIREHRRTHQEHHS